MKGRMFKVVAATLLWMLGHAAYAGTVTYVYTDPQGTPLAEADASGNITATIDYRPYGAQALGTPKNGTGYTGHVNDADSGLVYMQARYYDPTIGRFLGVDPVSARPGDLFGFNRFLYGYGNPIGNFDPDGLSPCENSQDCSRRLKMADQVVARDARTMVHLLGGPISGLMDFVHGMFSGNAKEASEGAAATIVSTVAPEGEAVVTVARAAREASEVNAASRVVTLSKTMHGEAAEHAAEAIAAGKPDVLTISRSGAAANRAEALTGLAKVPGKHLDEYPPAMFREGGEGASVRAIDPRSNMSAGACLGNACRGLPDGAKIKIEISD